MKNDLVNRLRGSGRKLQPDIYYDAANEIERLQNGIKELFEALEYMQSQHECGCERSACYRCDDYRENAKILGKTWI